MADSYIKILKEANGDITYPQTLASAVHTNNGSDVETEMGKYVTAEEIASTSALTPPVQTNMIADGAVTAAKINWSSFPCIETSFFFTNKNAGDYVDVATNKGTQLRIGFANGSVPMIVSGGDNIRMVEVKTSSKFSSGLTSGYQIVGVGSGAVIYTRKHVQYANSGTAQTGEQNTNQNFTSTIGGVTLYGADFSNIGSGTKATFFADYSIIKYDASNCSINGTLGSGGSLSGIQFESQVSNIPASVFPAIYQGGNVSYYQGGYGYIKVIEDSN